MTTIKPASFTQIMPSTALQDAKAMLEAARSSQTAHTESFSDRMGNAINSVADAQNNSLKLAQAYEMGLENDKQSHDKPASVFAWLSVDIKRPQQNVECL